MEPDSESPCFEKTMTQYMLQKNTSVMIPVSFISTHGHKLNTVLSLTGPNGKPCTGTVSAYSPAPGSRHSKTRYFLGDGWREFAKENDFQEGDCVVFKLVGNSSFYVFVSSKLKENANVDTKAPRLSQGEVERGTPAPSCEPNRNPKEERSRLRPGDIDPREKVKVEAVVKHPQLPKVEYIRHPGLEAAISSNSKFPRFLRKLSRSSLSSSDIRLEIPYRFAKEHGHKFQERVFLLGPNGQRRLVTIRIFSTFHTSSRVQFRHGWRAFSLENGFAKGDVLLFSLVGFSKFLVQVFPIAPR